MGDYDVMENHKEVCRKMAPKGWYYTGFDCGFYVFQKGDYSNGFMEMCCFEEDLTKENLELMAKMGLTRTHR